MDIRVIYYALLLFIHDRYTEIVVNFLLEVMGKQ